MLVIVEGPDGSGKTTLCNDLRKSLTIPALFLRSNGPPTSPVDMARISDWITRRVPARTHIVCDRFNLISEAVYGPVLRGKCLHDFGAKLIAQYLLTAPYPVLLLYCRPVSAAIAENIKAEEQRDGVRDNLPEIIKRYDQFMSELQDHQLQVIPYDFGGDSIVKPIPLVERFFNGQAR